MRSAELRALGRLGRRTARREWKRTLLIAILVAVPVASALVVAGVVRLNDIPPEEQVATSFGTADLRIESWESQRSAQGQDLDAWIRSTLDALAPGAETVTYRQRWDRQFGLVVDLDLDEPVAAGILERWEGELPNDPDEIALSPRLLRDLGVEIGDTVTLRSGDDVTVVGAVVSTTSFNRETAVVTPERFDRLQAGGDPRESSTRIWLVDGVEADTVVSERFNSEWEAALATFVPEPQVTPRPPELASLSDELYAALDAEQVAELVALAPTVSPTELSDVGWQMVGHETVVPQAWATSREVELRGWSGGLQERIMTPGVIATLVAGVLLAEVALVAGAAYATGARRRLRELGLLGANGATVAHVRVAVIGEAVAAGALGAAAGVLLGIGALLAGRPLLQLMVSRYIVGLPLTTGAVLGPAVAGVVAVVAAAWLPARTAARVPTVTALHGRMPLAAPPRWLVPLGVALFAFGGLMTTVALAATSGGATVLAVVGILTTIVGMAVLTPPIITRIGGFADRLPATMRLVVRDSARQRTRAAAATAAAMVLLMGPVLIGFGSASDEANRIVQGLQVPSDQVALAPPDRLMPDAVSVAGSISPDEEGYEASLQGLRAALPEATESTVALVGEFATLATAPRPEEVADQGVYDPSTLAPWEVSIGLATPEVIAALGDERIAEAVAAGTPVVLGIEERDTSATLRDGTVLEARELPVSVLWSFPRLLLPPGLASAHGLTPTAELTLFTEVDLADVDQEELWEVVTAGDLSVGYSMMSPVQTRWLVVGAALLVVLLTLGLVTALSSTESDHDLRTMVAVGAPPRIRRRFLGLQSGYHALIGAVLAVPLGAGLYWASARTDPWPVVGPFGARMSDAVAVPWFVLLAVVVCVPLVIGALTAGVFRSAPTVPPRRIG